MDTSYRAIPQIKLCIELPWSEVARDFEAWLKVQWPGWPGRGLSLNPLGQGYFGVIDVPDAEKVVEWLKDHGVEPRR